MSVSELKSRFSFYLLLVEHGERFEITRYGKPVAVISPVGKKKTFEESYMEFRKKIENDKSYTEESLEGGFDISRTVQWNRETIEAVEEGRKIARDPSVNGYSDMEELRKALEV
ncbi:MAG: type II toxin-antitoxin system prevent-host-death family antitoxin [Spirochaetales bacterium]|nr:type II toxin-antitoxin system prevent-host-death family antitoxin [Spirochaetales bacterium]